VDTDSNAVLGTVEVGTEPLGAVYADGELFVANNKSNTISIIDPLQRKVTKTMDVSALPAYLAACDGKLYATLQDNISGNRVAVINIGRKVEHPIDVGKLPMGVAVALRCQSLYVANHDNDTISLINPITRGGPLVAVGPNPQGVAVSDDGTYVYVACAGIISCVDAHNGSVVDKFSFSQPGVRFGWVAVVQLPDGKGDLVYATGYTANEDKVWMWHPQSGQYDSINVASRPFGLAVMNGGQRVYVCCAEGNVVQWLESQQIFL